MQSSEFGLRLSEHCRGDQQRKVGNWDHFRQGGQQGAPEGQRTSEDLLHRHILGHALSDKDVQADRWCDYAHLDHDHHSEVEPDEIAAKRGENRNRFRRGNRKHGEALKQGAPEDACRQDQKQRFIGADIEGGKA